ncbi:hypothetical protein BCR32DRAFT_293304 [Anaeromyces robustus]|uniref:C3H1-type domain-containing protein n=1 Tax=Anaeromyces robustus TaxID=1754192 RepID=A0A1Y1X6E7_9FUNG|nr:hypothetical protein BCR32DRAFT_293304 [Anaeromyces robustus]|eukprot:ORX81360.1 hypothetical protein BCR32DRAFT_293304 [Anaeromyces robustus]
MSSSTKDLLNQIALLSEAINKRKHQVQETKTSSGTSSPYYKPYYKPSRNVTLINNNSSSSTPKVGTPNESQNSSKNLYIKKGNKLIRLEEMNKQKDKNLLAIKKQAESPFIKKRNTLINKDFLEKMGKPFLKDTVATVKHLPPGQVTTILGVKYQKSLDGRRLTVYKSLDQRMVKINGIEFKLSPTGIKLVRKVTETNKAEITPKIVQYKNDLYYRTKSGNLTKNITKSLLLTNKLVNSEKAISYCSYYIRFGKCKNRKCRFIHDPDHVSLCPKFLKGNCQDKNCLLDHSKNPKKLPLCVHFQNGNCLNDNCPYVHVKLNENAEICKDFALKGICEKGLSCPKKHLYQCPEFANTGKCSNIKCIFLHVNNNSKPLTTTTSSSTTTTTIKSNTTNQSKVSNKNEDNPIISSNTNSLSIKPKFLQKQKKEKEKEKEKKREDIILFNTEEDLNDVLLSRQHEKEEEGQGEGEEGRKIHENMKDIEEEDEEDIESSDEEDENESYEAESIDVDMLYNEDNIED